MNLPVVNPKDYFNRPYLVRTYKGEYYHYNIKCERLLLDFCETKDFGHYVYLTSARPGDPKYWINVFTTFGVEVE